MELLEPNLSRFGEDGSVMLATAGVALDPDAVAVYILKVGEGQSGT